MKKLILLAVMFPCLLLAEPAGSPEVKPTKDPADKTAPEAAPDAAAALSEADQKRLTDLASANPIVAVVSLADGEFTGCAMVHRIKVKKALKGDLESTAVFASVNRQAYPKQPAAGQAPETTKPKLAPGDYLVISTQSEIVGSFPGNQKKGYNYTIQTDSKGHCAWKTNSPEALFLLQRFGGN